MKVDPQLKAITMRAVIDCLVTISTLGETKPEILRDIAHDIKTHGVNDDGCCFICEEVECDSDCPFVKIREINL